MDNNELKELQAKHLEMLKDFARFSEKNKLAWSLAYGSALGAARHKGPIPWDDDIDIIMPAADYLRLQSLMQEGESSRFCEKYYLQKITQAGGLPFNPKLRMNGTTYVEKGQRGEDMHQGIFMDIFILHNVPQNPLRRGLFRLGGYYLELKRWSNFHYKKRKIFIPLMAFMRLFPPDFGMRVLLKMQFAEDSKDDERLTLWGIHNKYMPKEMLFPFRMRTYEDTRLPTPHRIEDYLTLSYGDWRKRPNEAQISWSHHAEYWSASVDFRNYCTNIHTFSKEMGADGSSKE